MLVKKKRIKRTIKRNKKRRLGTEQKIQAPKSTEKAAIIQERMVRQRRMRRSVRIRC